MHQKDILKVIKRDNCTSIRFQSNYSVLMVVFAFPLLLLALIFIIFDRSLPWYSQWPLYESYLCISATYQLQSLQWPLYPVNCSPPKTTALSTNAEPKVNIIH